MSDAQSVGAELVHALDTHADRVAIADHTRRITYKRLAQFVAAFRSQITDRDVVGIFGAPDVAMTASAVACVIHGRPFVHLDPAMPQMVLHNIIAELNVRTIALCSPAAPGHLPSDCRTFSAPALLDMPDTAPAAPLVAASVDPADPIYLVATSGTTGRPKCIPVAHDAAYLSYAWRDAYTPYHPGMRVGIFIFAIWEMFRPLRKGGELWLPEAATLKSPRALADFLICHDIEEMLFTPSFYETFLATLDPARAAQIPLRRVVLNGEVVRDGLIRSSQDKLPEATLWNLYSICETHDVCMTRLDAPSGGGPVSVGVPMEHLRAVILDERDTPCPVGTPGQLHFAGPRMLGPGYVNRPEETRLRFRELVIDGAPQRLYDTGDQAWLNADGALHIVGRVAHMLKLRGYSIQTTELVETMAQHLAFGRAEPWVADVKGRGQSLIFYCAADTDETRKNAARWDLNPGINRIPKALSQALRALLPAYCIPAFIVQLEALPLHPVSGKADIRALPPVTEAFVSDDASADMVVMAAAQAMGCAPGTIDPAQSFHDQGGDSLMCVPFMLELEKTYGRPVDFDLAMNIPLHRLDQLLTGEADAPAPNDAFDRPGILLTGATGFLGGHVLAQAVQHLPDGHVVYCLVRDKQRGARDRLDGVAAQHGVDAARYVMVGGTLDAARFGLDPDAYDALAGAVTQVVHCAAMVNLAVGRAERLEWSARGIETVIAFCRQAQADLRFTSSSAVFPDQGGPWPEAPAHAWDGCTGYGAAKIAAEVAIAASDVPAAIVRLPSLYDLVRPNPRDIYEIILAASQTLGHMPEGLEFPMTDVTAAAAFLLGPITGDDAPIYNLMADHRVHAGAASALPVETWRASADLPSGIAGVIDEFPSTLKADAAFENTHAKAAWRTLSHAPYDTISDPEVLLIQRGCLYQSDPALT